MTTGRERAMKHAPAYLAVALFAVLAVPAQAATCSPTPYACNLGVQPSDLGASDCRASDGRTFDLLSFTARAGEVLTATMHAQGFAGYLAMVDARGNIVRTSTVESHRPAFVAFEALETGVYDLIVSTPPGVKGGHYRLALGCLATTKPKPQPCTASDDALCLGNGRFRVEAWWQTSGGERGKAGSAAISEDTGYFWFFREGMAEVMVKVLDACQINGRVWVFAGGLTNVHTALRVVDTDTDKEAWVYSPHDHPFQSAQLTAALPCE